MTTADLEAHRPRLLGLAYRMLSDRAEAEDVVQDARRSYHGTWLPEPIVGDPAPLAARELADDLSVAFLLLLERLAPEERAAFLLHSAFEWGHAEIAEALGKTEVAVRQMVHRARERIQSGRPRARVDPARAQEVLRRFLAAWAARDEAALREVLAADVTYTADGGGKVQAAGRVLHGAPWVIRLLLGLGAKYIDVPRVPILVGGMPGYLTRRGGRLNGAVAVETDGERILAFYAVVNPEKLRGTVA